MTGPRMPFWMLIWHAAMDGDIIGTMNGLTRSEPFVVRHDLAQGHLADTAAAGVDDHGDVVAVVVADLEARRVDRLARRGHGQLGEARHAPRLLEVHPVLRLEALDLGRDAHLEVGRVELLDRRDARTRPRRGCSSTSRRRCRWGSRPPAR